MIIPVPYRNGASPFLPRLRALCPLPMHYMDSCGSIELLVGAGRPGEAHSRRTESATPKCVLTV